MKTRSDSELSKKNGGIIRPKGIFVSKHFGLIHLAGLGVLKHFFKKKKVHLYFIFSCHLRSSFSSHLLSFIFSLFSYLSLPHLSASSLSLYSLLLSCVSSSLLCIPVLSFLVSPLSSSLAFLSSLLSCLVLSSFFSSSCLVSLSVPVFSLSLSQSCLCLSLSPCGVVVVYCLVWSSFVLTPSSLVSPLQDPSSLLSQTTTRCASCLLSVLSHGHRLRLCLSVSVSRELFAALRVVLWSCCCVVLCLVCLCVFVVVPCRGVVCGCGVCCVAP